MAAAAEFPHLDLFRYSTDYEHDHAKLLVEAAEKAAQSRTANGRGPLAYLKEVGGDEAYGLSLLQLPVEAVAAEEAEEKEAFAMPAAPERAGTFRKARKNGKKVEKQEPGQAEPAPALAPASPAEVRSVVAPTPPPVVAAAAPVVAAAPPPVAAAAPVVAAAPPPVAAAAPVVAAAPPPVAAAAPMVAAAPPPAEVAAASVPPPAVAPEPARVESDDDAAATAAGSAVDASRHLKQGTQQDPPPAANTVAALAQRFTVLQFCDAAASKDVEITGADGRGLVFRVGGRELTVLQPVCIHNQALIKLHNGLQFTVPEPQRREVLNGLEKLAAAVGVEIEYTQDPVAAPVTPTPPPVPTPPPAAAPRRGSRGGQKARNGGGDTQHLRQQKDYIKKHKLHVLLGDALDSCLRDLPPDPYFYLASTLLRFKESAGNGAPRAGTPAAAPQPPQAWGGAPSPDADYVARMESEIRHTREMMSRVQAEHELEKEVMVLRSQVAQLLPQVRSSSPLRDISAPGLPSRPVSALMYAAPSTTSGAASPLPPARPGSAPLRGRQSGP
eukprot:TRINITY_DN9301_c0_g3_i2.p1 TRINITY_DN9301_c0_g3~~TRINITY_DN9301_c0_g3_i2.p1  ORF type:complete len:587 (+),score=151.50 TRINITY_DN9301_c0_g3_i2:97-1761(+)